MLTRILYILILIISLLSCDKEEGFIPVQDKDEDYYPDHTPTLDWSVEASVSNNNYPLISGHPQIVNDIVIVAIVRRKQIKAYTYDEGELLWTTEISGFFNNRAPDDFEALEQNGKLYLVDKEYGSSVILDKENGKVLNAFNPEEYGLDLRFSFTAIIDENHYYMINQIDQDSVSLVRVNFVNYYYETIATLKGFQDIHDYSEAYFVPEDQKLYFSAILNRNSKSVFSIDIETGEIDKVWEKDEIYINYPIAVMDQLLLIVNDLNQVNAIDIKSGETIWTYENKFVIVDGFIIKGKGLYISDKDHLLSLDPTTGELKWEVDRHDLGFIHNFDYYKSEDILVGGSGKLIILDLTDGQFLVSMELPNPDTQPVVYISFDSGQRAVVIASLYHLFKYSDLLP